jgi:Protein of unknown function (DUF1311).
MKCRVFGLLVFAFAASSYAQSIPQNISPAQLQAVVDLPLGQAVARRESYKPALKAAYARQMALMGKDCEDVQAQQPYNVCMGHADDQADKDFATFYNNLQMLCHDQTQLAALQALEATWQQYRDSAMKATRAVWPDGTAAPGVEGLVYLSLVRNQMRVLGEIYQMNISQ